MVDERTGSLEKKNEGRGDESTGCWNWADQVEVRSAKGGPGQWEQEVGRTTGERAGKAGREMKQVDWRGTVAQEEGSQGGSPVPEMGSGGVGGQEELAEECHTERPHWLPVRCLQGAGSVHVPGHWHGRD